MIWADDRLFDPAEGIDSDTPTLPLGDGNSLLVSPHEMYGISRAEWSLIYDFALNRNSQA
jgi:hypothetical protein